MNPPPRGDHAYSPKAEQVPARSQTEEAASKWVEPLPETTSRQATQLSQDRFADQIDMEIGAEVVTSIAWPSFCRFFPRDRFASAASDHDDGLTIPVPIVGGCIRVFRIMPDGERVLFRDD